MKDHDKPMLQKDAKDDKPLPGGKASRIAAGAAAGAAVGAVTGALGGPPGAAIGAGAGAVIGGVMGAAQGDIEKERASGELPQHPASPHPKHPEAFDNDPRADDDHR